MSVRDIRTNLLRFLVFAGYGLIHGLVPALTPSTALTNNFPEGSRYDAALFAFVSVIFMAAGWYVYESSPRRMNRGMGLDALLEMINSERIQQFYKRFFWVSMFVGLGGWALYVRGTGSSFMGLAEAGRFQYRLTGDTTMMLVGLYLASFAFVPGFLGMFLPRNYRMIGISFTVVMALACFLVLSVGTRAIPLGMIGTIGVGYTLRHPISPQRFLRIITGCLLILWLTVSLYEVRKVMRNATFSQTAAMLVAPETYQSALVSDPLNYHENLVGAIDSFPQKHPYLDGATYIRILLCLVPGSYLPNLKPEDTNMVFARVVYDADPDIAVTIPPSIPGDAYINFWGWPGLIMMFFNGMILAWGNRKMFASLFWFTVLGPEFARFMLLVLRGQPQDLFLLIFLLAGFNWILMRLSGYSFRDDAQVARRSMGRGFFLNRRPLPRY